MNSSEGKEMLNLIGNELLVSVPAHLYTLPFSVFLAKVENSLEKIITKLEGKNINIVGSYPLTFKFFLKRRLKGICNNITFK